MTQSYEREFVYESEQVEQKAVVKITINGTDYLMDWEDWDEAQKEGRERAVIYGEKLILVDDETYEELTKLTDWIKNNEN